MGTTWDFSGGTLPGGMTLTRASSATYWDSSGVLRTATSNVARFDHDAANGNALRGLYYEGSATELLHNNTSLSTYPPFSHVGGTITAGQADPSGGTGAVEWSNSNTTGDRFNTPDAISISGSTPYRISIFAKAHAGGDNGKRQTLEVYDTGLSALAGVTPVTVSAAWERFTGSWTSGSGSPSCYFNLGTETGTNDVGNFDLWGASLKANATAFDSFIPCGSNDTTRAADQLTWTIPSGASQITVTFDDNSTQTLSVTGGASYTLPTALNRPWLKSIQSNEMVSGFTGTGSITLSMSMAAAGVFVGAGGVTGTADITLSMGFAGTGNVVHGAVAGEILAYPLASRTLTAPSLSSPISVIAEPIT